MVDRPGTRRLISRYATVRTVVVRWLHLYDNHIDDEGLLDCKQREKSHLTICDVTSVAYSNNSRLRMMASEANIDSIDNAAIIVENKLSSTSIYGWLRPTRR
jgi:hypothetical protein